MSWRKPGKNTRVLGLVGPKCRRCGRPTEVREHEAITQKELCNTTYYSRWYCCVNQKCRTTLIMPEEFKVFNELPVVEEMPRLNLGDDVVMDVLSASNHDERAPWED